MPSQTESWKNPAFSLEKNDNGNCSRESIHPRSELETLCTLADRWTDRQASGTPLGLLLALSHGDHWAGLRALEGTAPDSAGLLGTCKKGRRFVFPSLKQKDKLNTQFLVKVRFVGLGSVMVQKIILGHWNQ